MTDEQIDALIEENRKLREERNRWKALYLTVEAQRQNALQKTREIRQDIVRNMQRDLEDLEDWRKRQAEYESEGANGA